MRISQIRLGRSSRPIRNSSIRTPSSETWVIWSMSVTSRRTEGPIMTPATRYPSTLPRPNRRLIGTNSTDAVSSTTSVWIIPLCNPAAATAGDRF